MISIKKNEKIKKNLKSINLIKCLLITILIIIWLINNKKKLIICPYISKLNQTKDITKNCFLSAENSNKKIIHIIITQFMIEFYKSDGFPKKIYTKDYIENGIRVMKKYLIPSLQFQSCKDFLWMLKIGDKTNITYLKSLLNFYKPFKSVIIYNKDHKKFIRNITKNADVLITTRIDYDDRIYWNAVNDVRKAVNISKPMFLYGYNRGYIYFEKFDVYIEFFRKYKNEGTMSVFQSLIIFMNKVNDSYTIYDIGEHIEVRKKLLKNYKKYGLEKLDYEPAFIEFDFPKFVWVRQQYSGTFRFYKKPFGKSVHFNYNKFYGIKK